MLFELFGGREVLARALKIEDYPEATQQILLEKFSSCLFKRMLLCVPEAHVGNMIDLMEHQRAYGRSLDALIEGMKQYIPHMDACMEEALRTATCELELA